MPGPDFAALLALPAAVFWPAPGVVLAYGPGPPVDLIPYFLALAGWAGLALAAVLLSPLTALIRFLRRIRGAPPDRPKRAPSPDSSDEESSGA